MKRIYLTGVLFIVTNCSINAQSSTGFEKGDKLLNIGIGVNSYYNEGFPIGASFEVGISDVISVGGNVDYLGSKYNYGSGLNYKFTTLYIGARGSYHVNDLLNINNEKIDLYAGATIGFRNFSFKDNFSSTGLGSSYSNGVFFGGYVGGKYYFHNKLSVFTELGAIGSTNARLGLGFKF
ncbi:hypothetical protein [Ferruginibacter sp.]|nr:hypothetical protein [Ferruginibacter sp.]